MGKDCRVVRFPGWQHTLGKKDSKALIRNSICQNLYCKCDSHQVKRVFHNLICNALEATNEHDTIHLGAKVDEGDDFVEVWVENTGSYIPEDLRKVIFDPFVTTKKSLGRLRRGGNGLGTSICQKIIRKHGGTIACSSCKHRRVTRFTFTLPVLGASSTN